LKLGGLAGDRARPRNRNEQENPTGIETHNWTCRVQSRLSNRNEQENPTGIETVASGLLDADDVAISQRARKPDRD